MSEALRVYVLDTSAWLTLIEDESGADAVQQLVEAAQAGDVVLLTSFMSYMEIYYITLQERNVEEATTRIDLLASLPVLRVESSPAVCIEAAEIKAGYRLSVADAWIAALAKVHGAVLDHKDPEFEQVGSILTLLPLPFKGQQIESDGQSHPAT